jgi:hypothetical protein
MLARTTIVAFLFLAPHLPPLLITPTRALQLQPVLLIQPHLFLADSDGKHCVLLTRDQAVFSCPHHGRPGTKFQQKMIILVRIYGRMHRINVTAAAALDSKAGLGIAILPNLLVRTVAIDVGARVRLDPRSCELILCVERCNCWPAARSKSIAPPP